MRADYHVHPNIPAYRQQRHLKAYWEAIEKSKVEAIICTEHVYKDAANAYRKFIEAQPPDSQTHVFPGAELISSEGRGIEIIAFGKEDWYDRHPELLKPFAMTFEQMIRYLDSSDLSYFIPHPFLIGNPLFELFASEEEILGLLNRVPAFEVWNGCYLLLEKLSRKFHLNCIAARLQKRYRVETKSLTKRHQFLAVGSDAHYPKDIGFSVNIPRSGTTHTTREEAFTMLTSNTDLSIIVPNSHLFSLKHLLCTLRTTFAEGLMKKGIKVEDYFATAYESFLLRLRIQLTPAAEPATIAAMAPGPVSPSGALPEIIGRS